MKRTYSLIIALTLVIAVFLTGCGSDKNSKQTSAVGTKNEEGGTLVYPIPSDISSLNLMYETGDEGFTMLKPVYDSMYEVTKEGVTYYLAESHEVSQDGLSVTVKLKNNLTWHDGKPLTADDAVFNINARLNDVNKSTNGVKVNGKNVSVEKIDNLTFKVKLPCVSASYVKLLGQMKLVPKHIYEGEKDLSTSSKNMLGIGSGPYKVKEWKKGESLVLERYDNYYRGKPSLDSIIFKIVPNDSSQEIALQNGELSLKRISSKEKLDKYKKDDKYKIFSFSEGRINYMAFNSNSTLMKDIKVREAISSALNIDDIIKGAYGSSDVAVPAKSIFGPSNFYYDDIDGYKQDIEKAKKLIKETGLEGKTLKFIYNSSRENMKEVAQIIQQQLKAVGVNIEVTGYETQGFFEKFFFTTKGDWDLGLNGYAANGDPDEHRSMFMKDSFLCKNVFASEEAKALWLKADSTLDTKERASTYAKLQKLVQEEYTMYPISSPNFIMASDKHFEGLDAIKKVPVFEDYLKIHKTK